MLNSTGLEQPTRTSSFQPSASCHCGKPRRWINQNLAEGEPPKAARYRCGDGHITDEYGNEVIE